MTYGFRKILVPLDGTPSSELALQAAMKAASKDALITLVQIAEDIVSSHHLPDEADKEAFWEKQAAPVREYLEKLKGTVARPDFRFQTMVASGHPAEAILDIASELQVDAVAMCTHSSKVRQIFLGSTVQSVMSRCKVPVLVVHPT